MAEASSETDSDCWMGLPLVLHAGTKVKIEKEKKEFVRIYFSDGKIGWINKREAGMV